MVEARELILCPFVSQLYSSKCQDMKLVLSKHLFGSEEVLRERSEGKGANLEMVSHDCGNKGHQRDSDKNKIHKISSAAKRDAWAEDVPIPGRIQLVLSGSNLDPSVQCKAELLYGQGPQNHWEDF